MKKTAFVLLMVIPLTIFSLTGFGESGVFEISDEVLPVVLSSFTAVVTSGSNVQLNWVTQSETNLSGYYVYRNLEENLGGASLISSLIQPTNSTTGESYYFQDTNVENNVQYYYWLQSLNMDGTSDFHGPISILVNLEEENDTPSVPLKTGLVSVYPNPFNPSTEIAYQLEAPSTIEINIFNIKGQMVRSFSKQHAEHGSFSIPFDGRDFNGNSVASGVYYVIMKANSQSSSLKMVLLK